MRDVTDTREQSYLRALHVSFNAISTSDQCTPFWPAEKGVKKKKRSFSTRNIISWARVQAVCNPLTKPTFVPRIALLSPMCRSGRSCKGRPFHACLTRRSSLAFRRATNPRTGNDWQPFRTRRGLAALYAREGLLRDESNFESRGAFLRAAKPDKSVPAVGLLTTQSARD